MKIYKVWQEDVCGYDTYDSAVIRFNISGVIMKIIVEDLL